MKAKQQRSMSEFHSFVNDVSDFFAELDNYSQMLEDGLLIIPTVCIHTASATYETDVQLESVSTLSPRVSKPR